MKIAISSDGNTVDSNIDQRFGRCKFFIIADTDDIENAKAIENPGAVQGHGAGIMAAEEVGKTGAEAVITGEVGPNSSRVLEQLGIKSYHASGKVRDAIDSFSQGNLEAIGGVAEAHSGLKNNTKDTPSVTKKEGGERIFFPLLADNGEESEISLHFGHAPFFGLYDTEKKELNVIKNELDHTDPAKSPIDQIQEKVNPTTIFAQDIGGRAVNIIKEKGLHLKTGKYKKVKDVLENLDDLEDLTEGCGH